jgi:DNA repair/transcription protein MET18/MMS19
LSKFLSAKLDDHYTVSTAALPGLNILLRRQPLTTDQTSHTISLPQSLHIIKCILKEIHVQSLIQPDRNLIFNMIKYVLTNSQIVELIKTDRYETDFVYSVIQAVDGEKDPRNLLVSFEILRSMCQQLSLGPFVEETFDVFACYFPIDFTPVILDNKFFLSLLIMI